LCHGCGAMNSDLTLILIDLAGMLDAGSVKT
jgi:hypothetical protein